MISSTSITGILRARDLDIVGGNLARMKTVLVDMYDNQQDKHHDCSVVIRDISELPDALRILESG